MNFDTQFWHYSKAENLGEVPYARGVSLEFWKYENLVVPGVEGVRDAYAIFECASSTAENVQWFPTDDLNKAFDAFSRRTAAEAGSVPPSQPLEDIEQKWGEDEVVAECRSKGKDLKISRAGSLFYVESDGRRTQVRLDDRAVVRYLINALEDGS
jgi:hypothetical protein